MSKKVLILSSSPRKRGNSAMLCARFAEGAREAGHQVEQVAVAEKNIHYCTGCYACRRTGECAQKDDMAAILKSMIEADAIVMATPVYFYTMCAQLKTVIDRTVAGYTQIRNKEFYFIVTAADSSKPAMKPTLDGLRAFTGLLSGARERGAILGVGAWNMGDIAATPAMDEAYKMGRAV